MTKVISIMTQKGGVGKSTLTNAVMLDWCFKDLLRAKKMPKILLIDADAQASIGKLRLRDIEICKMDLESKEFAKLNGTMQMATKEIRMQFEAFVSQLKWWYYNIFLVRPDDNGETLRRAIQLIESGDYDYVFIDMPGSLYQEVTAELFACIDFLFVPVCLGNYDVQSSLDFCNTIKGLGATAIAEMRWFFNKYEMLKETKFNEIERELHASTGVPFLKTRVRSSSFFSSRSSSTVIPPTYRINLNTLEVTPTPRTTNVGELTDEIRKLIKLEN
ncbi:MAG: ParA family protein [Prevotellaceae bacterium]|jgi:cellulose biosynthesis protein BcsQ|nr:ParA family protein [Prevotellaceae bacterium]